MDDFAAFYQEGGGFMHAIALCAVIGAGVMVERFIFLFFRFNINGGQFFNQIQKLVMANNIDRAIKLCNAADKAALARVVKAGLTRANKSEADIAAAIEEAMLEVSPAISKRVPMLGAVANLATLLGLLGTIFGMIFAFEAVASVAADQRSQALAKGIVQGTENPLSNFWTQGMHEVQSHLSLTRHGYLGYAVISSERFWSRLGAEERALLTQALNESMAYGSRIAGAQQDKAMASLKDWGRTDIYEPTLEQRRAMARAVETVYSELGQRIGPNWIDDVRQAIRG